MRTLHEVLELGNELRRTEDRARRHQLFNIFEEDAIFECRCCGHMVAYLELEYWICNFEEADYICSECYEEDMGDDL